MNAVRIKTLDWADDALVRQARALIVAAFDDGGRYGEERMAAEICQQRGPFYRQFFVAQREGRLLGVAGIKGADWASDTHILYLSAVAKEFRNQGIGRALVQTRLDWLLANNSRGRILVSTVKPRRFKKLGFRVIDGSRQEGRWLMMRLIQVD
ncbi:MAG: GNAT family N-acetyltransferase [Gammaproteobacteria bacterium]|nr:GNAT family N-acetyltransferase [Gammaproteobacteria bacterium]MBU1656424.1 GNAT family N-acetyltransferase [Gammaproteobacteria bacterium]MBU1960112.1 GNAT family N-acetyltransferase [Gammaproteobacteria bacterium]